MWTSGKARRLDLTVVTQLSVDRMPALFNQCSTFTGEMGAAGMGQSVKRKKKRKATSMGVGFGFGSNAKCFGWVGDVARKHFEGCQEGEGLRCDSAVCRPHACAVQAVLNVHRRDGGWRVAGD